MKKSVDLGLMRAINVTFGVDQLTERRLDLQFYDVLDQSLRTLCWDKFLGLDITRRRLVAHIKIDFLSQE